jgi:glucan phosphoethanolaminetransferase (alkaline phosphatase superfamily)
MIQRIQSVYLLLAAAALVTMFFTPISVHSFRGLEVPFLLLERSSGESISAGMMINLWPLMSGVILLILLALLSIFLFKNRIQQMRMVMISALVNILLIIGVFWMANTLSSRFDPEAIDHQVAYQFGAYLPVVSLLFFILAHRGIKKDERMVRAASRLR